MVEAIDRKARKRIQALEEQGLQRDRKIAELTGRFPCLASTVEAIRAAVSGGRAALPPAPPGFASLIVADFPALFAEFGGKRFALLWRGSRDGFRARDFHGCCNRHAPTLALILDTEGNIFGGFTPVRSESRECNSEASKALGWDTCFKADPSLRVFFSR
jgi:hypothetical protein